MIITDLTNSQTENDGKWTRKSFLTKLVGWEANATTAAEYLSKKNSVGRGWVGQVFH